MKCSTSEAMSMLAGAGVGVLAMFLLDPQSGHRRRRQIAAVSREAFDAAGETVGPVVGSLASGTARVGRSVFDTVGEYGSRLADAGSRAVDTGAHYAAGTGEAISEGSSSLWHRGKRLVGAEEEHHSYVPSAGTAIGGVGLIALGAAAIWLFDPDQGEGRRSWLRDKSFSLLRDAGDLARKTGRHIGNQAKGTVAEARARFAHEDVTDEQVVARVRSELGRVVRNMSAVIVTAQNGYVTLSGTIPQDEIPAAEAAARAVRGVRDLHVQLQSQSAPQQSGQPFAAGSGTWTGGGQTPAPAGG